MKSEAGIRYWVSRSTLEHAFVLDEAQSAEVARTCAEWHRRAETGEGEDEGD